MRETATTQAVSCAKSECSEPGKWRPVIHVFLDKGTRVPGEAVIQDALVCDGHKEEAAKSIVDNDECWTGILRVFAGRGKIDRTKTQVSFEEATQD